MCECNKNYYNPPDKEPPYCYKCGTLCTKTLVFEGYCSKHGDKLFRSTFKCPNQSFFSWGHLVDYGLRLSGGCDAF